MLWVIRTPPELLCDTVVVEWFVAEAAPVVIDGLLVPELLDTDWFDAVPPWLPVVTSSPPPETLPPPASADAPWNVRLAPNTPDRMLLFPVFALADWSVETSLLWLTSIDASLELLTDPSS
jgi:hypothetical protein